jgi:hypothetical protein
MSLSFLRPVLVAALAVASLASCGGTATFDINGTVIGQKYPGLVLVETVGNQTITLDNTTAASSQFSFPNSIDYGTAYNVQVRTTPSGQPAHQTCSFVGGSPADTAGRQSSINMILSCSMTPHSVLGTIKMVTGTTGSYVGLQLINGSQGTISVSDATQVSYAFPNIVYQETYGITIFKQPTDATIVCELIPKDTPAAGRVNVSGTMGDADVTIDVLCKKR